MVADPANARQPNKFELDRAACRREQHLRNMIAIMEQYQRNQVEEARKIGLMLKGDPNFLARMQRWRVRGSAERNRAAEARDAPGGVSQPREGDSNEMGSEGQPADRQPAEGAGG